MSRKPHVMDDEHPLTGDEMEATSSTPHATGRSTEMESHGASEDTDSLSPSGTSREEDASLSTSVAAPTEPRIVEGTLVESTLLPGDGAYADHPGRGTQVL